MVKLPPFRLHEIAFGAFLVVTSLRLAVAGSGTLALAFGAMALAIVLTTVVSALWPGAWSARVRLLLFPVLVNVTYPQLFAVVAALHSPLFDFRLLRLDELVLGATPSKLLDSWTSPLLTEILSGCYLLFFPAVFGAFFAGVVRCGSYGIRLFNGLITIYALGFLGYTLVPAVGPQLATPEMFTHPLDGGLLTHTNAALVARGSNHVDVFPSLHSAITLFLMGWLWFHHRRLFFLFLLPALGLCTATLYLRYHYAVDLIAGFILGGIGLGLATASPSPHDPHPPLR